MYQQLLGESEGEVAVLAPGFGIAKVVLIESAMPCHDAQVMRFCSVLNPLFVTTVLAARSEDYTTAPQYLQYITSIEQLCFEKSQNFSHCSYENFEPRFGFSTKVLI